MVLRLFSIEFTRLFRGWLPWIALGVCVLFTGARAYSLYVWHAPDLHSGALAVPGLSFDLATSLDRVLLAVMPFIVVIGSALMGSDYAQRTHQHWLIRASREQSILAKFALMALVIVLMYAVTLLAGGGFGLALKGYLYGSAAPTGVNVVEALLAPLYLTIAALPYAALMLLLALVTRSTLVSVAIGFIYTVVIEMGARALFADALWIRWLPGSLHLSATYHLNAIGNKVVEVPTSLHDPMTAVAIAAAYTAALLGAAIWIYRRQDLGG